MRLRTEDGDLLAADIMKGDRRIGAATVRPDLPAEANARLWAAAPELLSIVRRFVALPSGDWNPIRHSFDEAQLMEDARAAIARATPNPKEAR